MIGSGSGEAMTAFGRLISPTDHGLHLIPRNRRRATSSTSYITIKPCFCFSTHTYNLFSLIQADMVHLKTSRARKRSVFSYLSLHAQDTELDIVRTFRSATHQSIIRHCGDLMSFDLLLSDSTRRRKHDHRFRCIFGAERVQFWDTNPSFILK